MLSNGQLNGVDEKGLNFAEFGMGDASPDMILWSPGMTLEQMEKQVILKAFRHFRGVQTTTANALGIGVRTLYDKLSRYKAEKREEDGRAETARIEREYQRTRARGVGQLPDAYLNSATDLRDPAEAKSENSAESVSAETRFRVESSSPSPAQPTVPVPERGKVQRVLPSEDASRSHGRKR